MDLDISKIEFSRNDIKRNLKLPKELNSELAEDVGFHIGDGYMKNRKGKGFVKYEFVYSGDYFKDINYFKEILLPRKRSLFNLSDIELKNRRPHELFLRVQSKALFLFYKNILNVRESPKKDIKIPDWIFSSLEYKKAFLRGLMDSDGCIRYVKNNYPIIHFQFQGNNLIKGIGKILNNIGISFCSFSRRDLDKRTGKLHANHRLQISGRKNLKKWMDNIGFNNKKHIERYNSGSGQI
jgi:intein/homing endonuclease